jgi:hypothetical protein
MAISASGTPPDLQAMVPALIRSFAGVPEPPDRASLMPFNCPCSMNLRSSVRRSSGRVPPSSNSGLKVSYSVKSLASRDSRSL